MKKFPSLTVDTSGRNDQSGMTSGGLTFGRTEVVQLNTSPSFGRLNWVLLGILILMGVATIFLRLKEVGRKREIYLQLMPKSFTKNRTQTQEIGLLQSKLTKAQSQLAQDAQEMKILKAEVEKERSVEEKLRLKLDTKEHQLIASLNAQKAKEKSLEETLKEEQIKEQVLARDLLKLQRHQQELEGELQIEISKEHALETNLETEVYKEKQLEEKLEKEKELRNETEQELLREHTFEEQLKQQINQLQQQQKQSQGFGGHSR